MSQDVLPYSCFIEGCITPDEMYLTSDTLLAHLLEEHSTPRWICDFCALWDETNELPGVYREFSSAEKWQQHTTEKHRNRIITFREPQLAELAELNKRPMIGPLSCPLCSFTMPNMSSKVDSHILHHLHEFSLRALPDPPESGHVDEKMASSVTAIPSHISQVKVDASQTGHTHTLSAPNLNNLYNDLIDILPSSRHPSLQQFLAWIQGRDWAVTEASHEFWATQFAKLQHVTRTYNQPAIVDTTPAVMADIVAGIIDELLTLTLERNPKWYPSSNSYRSMMPYT